VCASRKAVASMRSGTRKHATVRPSACRLMRHGPRFTIGRNNPQQEKDMALTKVDASTYDRVVSAVPEHPAKVRAIRASGSIFYQRQYVFDQNERIVAFHDDTEGGGQRWADVSFLTKSP